MNMEQSNSGFFDQMADQDFMTARQKEFISRIQNLFNPGREELFSLHEVKRIIRPKGETYLGMQAIPIDLIVGSEGRYNDFNQTFMPKHDYLKSRWKSVDKAHYQDISLPPIRLYEIGGVYFVRDGNHRVSVARAKGIENIDAEVTSLNSEIRLSPGMSRADLVKAVIAYEKDLFYDETYFGLITDCYDLDFSSLGQYDVIINHILVHKYFINQETPKELPLSHAIKSWYEKVYKPIIELIDSEGILQRFPGKTSSDLYVWIVRFWDDLKNCYGGHIPVLEAVQSYSETFGLNRAARIKKIIAGIFRKGKKGKARDDGKGQG
jgi:hypothetical protein